MKIPFKKKRLLINLFFGLIFLLSGVPDIIEQKAKWTDYVFLIVGFLYIGHYLYDLKVKYISIEDDLIFKNGLYGSNNKINLKKVNEIAKYADDLIIKTDTDKLKIRTNSISEASLNKLKERLEKLKLPKDKMNLN